MCGRYGFIPKDNFYRRFEITDRIESLKPQYNICPGMSVPVITRNSPNKLEMMKWGLIPSWAKDPRIGYKMINARAETLLEKPAFRKPFLMRRCLVPASGFFEWKKIGSGKIPFYIRLKNTDVFAFAGLYDVWRDAEGYPLKSFSIITTTPNSLVAKIHNRMPVIMREEFEDIWLDPGFKETEKLRSLLIEHSSADMEAYPVSGLVNSPGNDSEEIIRNTGQESLLI